MRPILEYLYGRGAPFLVLPYGHAMRPEQTAARHGVEEGELARTLVIMAAAGPALAVIPGDRRLDLGLARVAMDDPEARPATDRELDLTFHGYDPACLPPLGLYFLLPTYVDREVVSREQVVFPAGRPGTLVCVQTQELFKDDPVTVCSLTRESFVIEPHDPPGKPAGSRFDTDADLPPVHLADSEDVEDVSDDGAEAAVQAERGQALVS